MSKWDELEKLASLAEAQGLSFRAEPMSSDLGRFCAAANPKAVLSLIEQNMELVKALQAIAADVYDPYCRIATVAKAAIRKATGEEE